VETVEIGVDRFADQVKDLLTRVDPDGWSAFTLAADLGHLDLVDLR
jgi:ankyrin repeat protein